MLNGLKIGACLLGLLFALAVEAKSSADSIERLKDAVVKIHTTSAPPDYFTPWRLLNAKQSSGSGAVIHGQRILTNAHVIADASYIQVQKHGAAKKYLARVAFVSHEADLALLEVDDADFFEGLRPLKIGKLPAPLQEVSVFGYPFGGSTLSITRGVLSRVEHQNYAHAGGYLLAGQLDAAINPGNSGGPVIVDNKVVGVVMQANTSGRAENLGYFVPPSVIRHVLSDAEDGQHHGFIDLGFRTQSLDSPAMKRSYGLAGGLADQSRGILVAHVFEGSAASGVLQPNDVLLSIDGFELADDSTIEFRKNQRTNFKYAIDQYHQGDQVPVRLLRQGQEMHLSLNTERSAASFSLVQPQQFDQPPRYLIYGGVVFVPLNMNLIKRWGRDWHRQAPVEFLHARNRWVLGEQRELVVALKVLAADVNLGYHDWKNWILGSVDGVAVKDFEHFCHLLAAPSTSYTTLRDAEGYQMVIDRQQATATETEVLQRYHVPSPRSPGLCETD